MLNYFKVLGLEIDASLDHVKKAFRALAKQWHPDKNANPGAEDRFKEIKAAYEYLQSDDRRDIHAADIRRHHSGDKERAWPPTPPPPPPREAAKDVGGHHARQQRAHAETHSAGHDGGRRSKPHGSSPSPPRAEFNGASKRRGQRFDRAAAGGPPNATDGQEARSGRQPRQRAKADVGGGGAFHRDPNATPTFEYVFDFMSFDPFMEDILNMRRTFDFCSPPPPRSRPTAEQKKSKKRTDPFGNPLPDNVDPGIYDWSAPGFVPTWTDLGDPEFFCHYCGRLMAITLLRRHEPKCARLGGSRKTWFLDPNNFNDDESVIHATRQKLAQRTQQQQQQQQPKSGDKSIECQRCGLSIDEGSAASHHEKCKQQRQPEPPPTEEQPEQEGHSRSKSGPRHHHHHHHHHQHHHHGHSHHHHHHRHHQHHQRSASAHPRPAWNNNFSEDTKHESDTPRSGQSDGSGQRNSERHRRHEDQSPLKSKGCEKCIARFGRHAGFFCSCSVSHCL